MLGVVDGISKSTVPEGVETRQYILNKLKTNIEELQTAEAETPAEESIPPRPLPAGSRYLNPEEVNWLLKYDPKVKASAERYVKWFRREHPDECSLMNDAMIIETSLKMLYKLNRRDPEIVQKLVGVGPSFFKQYEEGTPEQIVIRYLDSSSGTEASCEKSTYSTSGYRTTSVSSGNKAARREELLKEKKQKQLLGVVCLFLFWPAAIYFFYKASEIDKEIASL